MAILIADNVDFGAAAARDGGVHHMALVVKLTFDEDPYKNEAYLAALAKSGLDMSSLPVVTRVPKFEKPDAVPLPKRDVNPPAAAHRPRLKTELVRDGKTFALSSETTEDDFLADHFPETFAVWLKAAVPNTATRSSIVKTLVQAAGDLLSWPAVLRASADLAAMWPLYVQQHVEDAATMQGRRVGSVGRMTSRPHEELAYAYATHTLGIDNTSRIGDHRKKTSMDDDRPQYQVIVPLTPILENPTGDKAMTLTVMLAIRVFDLFDQTAGLLVVDGGLFKKASQMVWPHEEYKKRIMVSNGDFHMTKTAHAAISAITKESGIAHLLVKSGVFDGITSAEHALSGGHVDNAMIGYSDLYLGLHGRLFDMWHAEALEADNMEEDEEEGEEEDGAAENQHAISLDEFASVKEALDAVNKGGAPGVAAAAVGSALGVHLEKYQGFLERVAQRTGNAAMWIHILRWIEIVLQHRRMMRSPEGTPEYVDMLEQLHTLCTLADRHNYAKGLAVQIAQWSTIEECFPSLLEHSNDHRWLLSANDLGINGHGKEHDLIIEYQNKRIKAGKGGITKLASSPDHFAAWFMCCTYRCQMEAMAQAFAPVTKRTLGKGKMGTCSRVEYRRGRSKREIRELAKLKEVLADERGNNPFAAADLALVQERSPEAAEAESKMMTRLTTGAALPDKVAASMLSAWGQGRERARLMLDRITLPAEGENATVVWAHAALLNVGRYVGKAVKPPKAERMADEMVGSLFFYLFQLVASGANLGDATVSPEELLEYGLTTGGAGSLFKPDGTMLKSNKSKWIDPLLGKPTADPGKPPQMSLLIWDFMAKIRQVHTWTKHDIVTFGSVAETVLRGMVKETIKRGYRRGGVVVDQYAADGAPHGPLKDFVQTPHRGGADVKIHDVERDGRLGSRQMLYDFLRDSGHKHKFVKLLLAALERVMSDPHIAGKIEGFYMMVAGEGHLVKPGGGATAETRLDTVVMEADMGCIKMMVVLAKTLDLEQVTLAVQDTDILNASVAFQNLVASKTRVWALRQRLKAEGDDRWYDIRGRADEITQEHGERMVPALLGAMVYSGCDVVSGFKGKGKLTAYKALCRAAKAAEEGNEAAIKAMDAMAMMGKDGFVSPGTVKLPAKFTRQGAGAVEQYHQLEPAAKVGMEVFLCYVYNRERQALDAKTLRLLSATKCNQTAKAGGGNRGGGKKKAAAGQGSISPSPNQHEHHCLRAHYSCLLWHEALRDEQPEAETSPLGYGWAAVILAGCVVAWVAIFASIAAYPPKMANFATTGGEEAAAAATAAAGEEEDEVGNEEEEDDDSDGDPDDDDGEEEEGSDDDMDGLVLLDVTTNTATTAHADAVPPQADADEEADQESEEEEDEEDTSVAAGVATLGFQDDVPDHLQDLPTEIEWMQKGATIWVQAAMWSASHPQCSTKAWWRGVVHDAGFTASGPRKDEWKGTITIKFTSDEGSPTTFQGQDARKRFARERHGPKEGSNDDRFVVQALPPGTEPAVTGERSRGQRREADMMYNDSVQEAPQRKKSKTTNGKQTGSRTTRASATQQGSRGDGGKARKNTTSKATTAARAGKKGKRKAAGGR